MIRRSVLTLIFTGQVLGWCTLQAQHAEGRASSQFPVSISYNCFLVSPAGLDEPTVMVGTTDRCYRSTDGGKTWAGPMTALWKYISALASCPNGSGGRNIVAATLYDGMFISTDSGSMWRLADTSFNRSNVTKILSYSDGVGETRLFAGTQRSGIYRSTSYGESWDQVNQGLATQSINTLAFTRFDSGKVAVFAGGTSGIYRTTDVGESWLRAGLEGIPVHELVSAPGANGDTSLFALSYSRGIYRSTDKGTTWLKTTTGITYAGFEHIASSAGVVYVATDYGFYRSTDNGGTWMKVWDQGGGYVQALAVVPNGSGKTNIVAGVFEKGIYLSSDGGNTWASTSLVLTAPSNSNPLVSVCRLECNYPNPFNPSTRIQLTISDRHRTIVSVYDALGREVANLMNEVKEPGVYTLEFDGTGLANGVYLCRMQSGNFTQSRKLVLQK
jgi:photosystem II stability/assembly factor-like uncharacterized protein